MKNSIVNVNRGQAFYAVKLAAAIFLMFYISACGEKVVKATNIDTSYIVAGVVRCNPADNTWYVEENVNHASTGIESVVDDGDHLTLTYAFNAGYTVSFTAASDATFAQNGIQAGGAVGTHAAAIYFGQNGHAITPLEACAYPTGNLFIFGMFKGQ